MSAPTTFNCDGCGKSYALKAEIAGRKVKCKCGVSMIAPELPVEEDDELYDLVDDAPKAKIAPVSSKTNQVGGAIPSETPIAMPVAQPIVAQPAVAQPVGSSTKVSTKRHVEYRRGLTQKERDRNASPIEKVRDVFAPLVLLTLGLFGLIGVMAFGYGSGTTQHLAIAMIFVGIYALIKTVVMVGAAFIAAPMASVAFGPTFWTVMLKLAAIALFPEAVDSALDLFTGGISGLAISMLVVGVCYLILFRYFFSIELDDSWLVVRIMLAVRFVLEIGIVALLYALA
ncbi:MAG TPA: hypothetical protein PK402_05480 [Tepidisphaeraceae bacterium]|nr:hypothetical protein [Tepidisphaeraceae bacterium]